MQTLWGQGLAGGPSLGSPGMPGTPLAVPLDRPALQNHPKSPTVNLRERWCWKRKCHLGVGMEVVGRRTAPGRRQPRAVPERAESLAGNCWLRLTGACLSLQITFYVLVKATYTLGYSVSLASLTTGSVILCLFR